MLQALRATYGMSRAVLVGFSGHSNWIYNIIPLHKKIKKNVYILFLDWQEF